MPVAQRIGWGRTQCDPLLLGEDLSKIHTVGLSIHPPKIHTAGHPPFPIPQPHSPSGAQNPTMGNWPQRGPLGGAFCTPHFGPMGKWPQIQKNWGVQFWEPPILGPLGVTYPFLHFRTPEHQRTTWTTHTPTDTQPIARKPTYLAANLNLTRSLASLSPTLGQRTHLH